MYNPEYLRIDTITDIAPLPKNQGLEVITYKGKTWVVPAGRFELGERVMFVPAGRYTLRPEGCVQETMHLPYAISAQGGMYYGTVSEGTVLKCPKVYRDTSVPITLPETLEVVLKNRPPYDSMEESRQPVITPAVPVVQSHQPSPVTRYHYLPNWAPSTTIGDYAFKQIKDFALMEWVEGVTARYTWDEKENRLRVAGPKVDRPEDAADPWWMMAREYELETTLVHDPYRRFSFMCRIFGNVKDEWTYDRRGIDLLVYDIHSSERGRWLDYPEIVEVCNEIGLNVAPCLYVGRYESAENWKHKATKSKSVLYNGPVAGGYTVAIRNRDLRTYNSGSCLLLAEAPKDDKEAASAGG